MRFRSVAIDSFSAANFSVSEIDRNLIRIAPRLSRNGSSQSRVRGKLEFSVSKECYEKLSALQGEFSIQAGKQLSVEETVEWLV